MRKKVLCWRDGLYPITQVFNVSIGYLANWVGVGIGGGGDEGLKLPTYLVFVTNHSHGRIN